jgi:hypothetical protein
MEQLLKYWSIINTILLIVSGLCVYRYQKKYEQHLKEKEIRYSLFYKSKIDLILSFEASYLSTWEELNQLIPVLEYELEYKDNFDQLFESYNKYLKEFKKKAFSLNMYVGESEGGKITLILSNFHSIQDKITSVTTEMRARRYFGGLHQNDKYFLYGKVGENETTFNELQKEIRELFLSKL